jgi:hypothetical protein
VLALEMNSVNAIQIGLITASSDMFSWLDKNTLATTVKIPGPKFRLAE